MARRLNAAEVRAALEPVDDVSKVVKAAAHSRRLAVMVMLADGPMEFSAILAGTGLSKTALSNHVSNMLAMGLIERLERGKYKLTEDGGELLDAIASFYSMSQARVTQKAQRTMERYATVPGDAMDKRPGGVRLKSDALYQPCWISYLGAVSGTLKSLGKNRDVVDVGGYTGYSFISNVAKGKTCPSGPTALRCWPAIVRATGVLGYKVSSYEDNESFPQSRPPSARDHERARKVYDLVRKEIDRERPVVLWGLDVPEYGIVKGYEGESYLVSTYRRLLDRPDAPIRFDALEAPGCLHAVTFREETQDPDESADKESLRRAIRMADGNGVPPVGYVAGPESFVEWAKVLESGDDEALNYHGNSYLGECQHEAKEIAGAFLARLAKRHGGAPHARHLSQAVQEYAASQALLKQFTQLFPFAMQGKMTVEDRRKGAGLLRQVEIHERAAIGFMKEASKAWR